MIHVFPPERSDPDWQVWTDCEPEHHKTGRILGLGVSKLSALTEALFELEKDGQELQRLLKDCFNVSSSDGIAVEKEEP